MSTRKAWQGSGRTKNARISQMHQVGEGERQQRGQIRKTRMYCCKDNEVKTKRGGKRRFGSSPLRGRRFLQEVSREYRRKKRKGKGPGRRLDVGAFFGNEKSGRKKGETTEESMPTFHNKKKERDMIFPLVRIRAVTATSKKGRVGSPQRLSGEKERGAKECSELSYRRQRKIERSPSWEAVSIRNPRKGQSR